MELKANFSLKDEMEKNDQEMMERAQQGWSKVVKARKRKKKTLIDAPPLIKALCNSIFKV